MSLQPESFERRILVAVCGLTPQILTETLYALAVSQAPAFIPTEIHLLTTREGAHRADLTLLHTESGQFHKLCQDYQLPKINFDQGHIHVLKGADGKELDDVRSPQDNESLADFISQAIGGFAQDPNAALHVSIAGGRKTMGYYAGYALSLYGREQDRLSHVLVTADYEGLRDFYYPTPNSQVIYKPEDRAREKPLDASKAEVTLAEIPFIRLREDIPSRLLKGKASFNETIEAARRATDPAYLVINKKTRELTCNGIEVHLADIQLAFYLWVIEWTTKDGKPMPRANKDNSYKYQYAAHFQRIYEDLVGEDRDIRKTENSLKEGMLEKFFDDKVHNINKALKLALGARMAQPYCIISPGREEQSNYGIGLSADQIQII